MLRKILGVILGLIMAVVIFEIVETVSGAIFGTPEMSANGGMPAPQVIAEFMSKLPISAFLVLLLGYAVGSFIGGWLARKISKSDSLIVPVTIGVLLTLAWIMNFSMIPHPMWVVILGFFCYIPFAILGHRVANV